MVQVVISIGSNVDREHNICSALDNLHAQFGELLISPVYESASKKSVKNISNAHPVDEAKHLKIAPYYNLVISFHTQFSVTDVKHWLRDLENRQGRQRNTAIVSLDLDVLLYSDWVGEVEGSAVPHHDIECCAYVLRPLADLLPDQKHPVFGKLYSELWNDFVKDVELSSVDFVWRNSVISTSVCLPLL